MGKAFARAAEASKALPKLKVNAEHATNVLTFGGGNVFNFGPMTPQAMMTSFVNLGASLTPAAQRDSGDGSDDSDDSDASTD